ncbi:hypothetical protein V3C99_010531 [Haemonchus contortus]|uniref:Palmitoyltransferase n=1 Tax=Haemonchus contortus TaxID=6289 RepID=A0A7I4Y8T9_HAECO|nr:unnamed protein product [Haemonchus contortus]
MSSSEWSSQFRQFWITTVSVYVFEMAIFFIALYLYHHCFFMPRVRKKMYKSPQDEASKSLLRISGMLSDHAEKTQQDEKTDEAHRKEDATQRELNEEGNEGRHSATMKNEAFTELSTNASQSSLELPSPFSPPDERKSFDQTTTPFEAPVQWKPSDRTQESTTQSKGETSRILKKFDYEKPLPANPPPSVRLW